MTIDPMTLCVTGLMAVLSGLTVLGLSLGEKKAKRPLLTALGVTAFFAAAAAAALLTDGTGWLAVPSALLAAGWGVLTVLRTGVLEILARLATTPRGQGALLALAGIAALFLGLHTIDCENAAEMAEGDKLMRLVSSAPVLESLAADNARTDAGSLIPVFAPDAATVSEMEAFPIGELFERAHLTNQIIQTSPVDPQYNCHGWVFAAGHGWVRGSSVPAILKENGYSAVTRPVIGDLAIFTAGAEVTHSAIVRGLGAKGAILLESKWGKLGRYIHTADQHIYKGQKITYYHTARGGHRLQGLAPLAGEDVTE